MKKKEKLVTVARFENSIQADLARQLLEDEGIKAFVMGQNVGDAWGGPPASDLIELQTVESEAEEAREILEENQSESQEVGEDKDFDEDEPELDEDQDEQE